MRAILCLWLLFSCLGLALAQPNPTPSPHSELNKVVEQKLSEEDESRPPSAKDTDKPAVFGVMIAGRIQDKAGISVATLRRASFLPWTVSAFLLPIYLLIARRRGFWTKRSQP